MTTAQTIKSLAERIDDLGPACVATLRRYVNINDGAASLGERQQADVEVKIWLGWVPAPSTCQRALALIDRWEKP